LESLKLTIIKNVIFLKENQEKKRGVEERKVFGKV